MKIVEDYRTTLSPNHNTHHFPTYHPQTEVGDYLKSTIQLLDDTCVLCEIVRLNKRVEELLEGNTEEVLRRREAEAWLDNIQTEQKQWSLENFGQQEWYEPFTGREKEKLES